MLSIGTGVRPNKLQNLGSGADWGLVQWAPRLLDLLFDSSNRSVNLHMSHLLGQNYCRINPLLEERDVALDDVSAEATRYLRRLAEGVELGDTLRFVREHMTHEHTLPAAEMDWGGMATVATDTGRSAARCS